MGVLIVSADEAAARPLERALERARCGVEWLLDGASARAKIREAPPSVLVADMADPEHAELADLVRVRNPAARVFLMSFPADEYPQTTLPVVSKPFDAVEFASELRRSLELADIERSRRQVQATVEELAALVEASHDAIVGLDADGRIRSWNPAARAIYGYDAREILGASIRMLDESPSEALAWPARAESERRIEVQRRTKAGDTIDVILSVSAVRNAAGNLIGFAEVSADVSEHKRARAELIEAQRLAALGRMSAVVAHELNNPVSVIEATTALLEAKGAELSPDVLAEMSTDLRVAADRIRAIASYATGVARHRSADIANAPLEQTLGLAARLVRFRAQDAAVALEAPNFDPVDVPHDASRLCQAVVNLLANAIDAAADGGHHVWLRLELDDDNAVVLIEDDGPGVPASISDRVFEAFETTKPVGKGTGLGLSIVREVVSAHGGTVELVAREQGGTCARMSIPRRT